MNKFIIIFLNFSINLIQLGKLVNQILDKIKIHYDSNEFIDI